MTYDKAAGELIDAETLKQADVFRDHTDLGPITEADRALIVSNLCPDCGLYKFASEELCPACAEASLAMRTAQQAARRPDPHGPPAFLAWFTVALLIAVGSGVVVTVIMAVKHAVGPIKQEIKP